MCYPPERLLRGGNPFGFHLSFRLWVPEVLMCRHLLHLLEGYLRPHLWVVLRGVQSHLQCLGRGLPPPPPPGFVPEAAGNLASAPPPPSSDSVGVPSDSLGGSNISGTPDMGAPQGTGAALKGLSVSGGDVEEGTGKQTGEGASVQTLETEESSTVETPQVEGASATESAALKEEVLFSLKMVDIPGGSFVMGANDGREEEKPAHKVNLSSYKMSAYLVTNKQYRAFVLANPEWQKDRINPDFHDGKYLDDWEGNEYPEGKDDHPVAFVSFYAAEAFARWLGKRLPTEAEWEFAARGGLVGKKFPNGDKMNEKIANFAKRYSGTTPVGQFDPNGYGLYDMAGNLFEWTADWFSKYTEEEQTDPKGPSSGDYKVIRGGSWISSAMTLRVSFRIDEEPERCGYIGIRLAE